MSKKTTTLKKSNYKYFNTNMPIYEGDAVAAYGNALYHPEGELGFITYEDGRWYFESPKAKMGYFLKDVLDKGHIVKNSSQDDICCRVRPL